jgi:hypothetical protein
MERIQKKASHEKEFRTKNPLEVTNRSKYWSFRLGKIKSLHNPSRGEEKETSNTWAIQNETWFQKHMVYERFKTSEQNDLKKETYDAIS